MHVVLVTPFAPPERGASIIRVESLRSFVRQNGHTVTILSPAREGVAPQEGIIRYHDPADMFQRLLRMNNVDVILGTSPPSPPQFWVALACSLRGIPFVFDSKDPFIEYSEKDGFLSKGSPKHTLYSLMDAWAHRHAQHTLTLTRQDVDYIHHRYSTPLSNITLAPNGIDPDVLHYDSSARKKIRKEFSFTVKDKVIVYAGSLGDEKIHALLEHLPRGFAEKHRVHFLLILSSTPSASDQALITKIFTVAKEKKWSSRVQIVENVPYSRMKEYLSAGDIGFVPVPEHWFNCLPVKALDYAGAGLPIIGLNPSSRPFTEFLSDSNAGKAGKNWGEVVSILENALVHFSSFKLHGKKGMHYVNKHFLRTQTNEKILSILRNVIKK